jgi:3-oxoacyl-[acyl-carrier protein] reductase
MHRLATLARQLEGAAPSPPPTTPPTAPALSLAPCNGTTPTSGIFRGRVVLITGAAGGIGAAAARLYAQHGAAGLVLADLDAAALAKTAADCRALGSGSGVVVSEVAPLDVTAADAAAKLVAAVHADHAGNLHVLVNNAGYTHDGVLHKMGEEQWQAMLDVHATAPFRLMRDVAGPLMRGAAKREQEQGGATSSTPRFIVNVSSTSGTHGNAGQANYAAAKAAIVGLTKTAAKEWGPFGIRCNAVAFGLIDTRLTREKSEGATIEVGGKKVALGIPQAASMRGLVEAMAPLRRVGSAEEAAGAILLLSSEWASFVTGQCLECNGGSYM